MSANTQRAGKSPLLKKGPEVTSRGPSRGYYLESEAANYLGLTREEFRAAVRKLALFPENTDLSSARYQLSDLLAIRLMLNGVQIFDPAVPAEAGSHTA